MLPTANEIVNASAQPPLTMMPTFALPEDPLTIDYESQDEKDDSEYRVAWSNKMDKGNFRNLSTYKQGHVLLLRWSDTCDDLKIEKEVNDLKNVFEADFRFKAQIKFLDSSLQSRLQGKLNHIVAKFVDTHDGPDTLLIVYYAGHGKPGSVPGQLEVFGKRSPNDDDDHKKYLSRLIWNRTEELLRIAEADILEIFDCCHAGTLGLTRGQLRNFEYLGACGATEVTPLPGETSFTSALIWALKRLLETKPEGRFTTSELLAEIRDNAPHFPKEQHPVMRDRETGNHTGRIMLHPLQESSANAPFPADRETDIDQAKQHGVTLHFDFAEKPSVAEIDILGDQFNQLFERNTLRVNGIRWGGVKPSMFARVIHRFQSLQGINSKKRRVDAMKIGAARLLAGHVHDLPTPSPEVEDSLGQGDLAHGLVTLTKMETEAMDSVEDVESQNSSRRAKRRKLSAGSSKGHP